MRSFRLLAVLAAAPAVLFAATPEERPPQPQDPAPANGNVVAESRGPATRTTNGSGRNPLNITNTTAQTFYCTQPDPRQDACYINVYYTSGTYSDTFGALHISINGKIVFRAQGFFQQTAYTYNSFAGLGFRVACGPPVDDPGDPASVKRKIGNGYTVDLKWNGASGVWDIDDQMLVRCPPYNP